MTDLTISGDESFEFRAVITRLEVIETSLVIEEVSLELERIELGNQSCLVAISDSFSNFTKVAVGIRN